MINKLDLLKQRLFELDNLISNPEIINEPKLFQSYLRERKEVEGIVSKYEEYKRILKEKEDAINILESSDEEMANFLKTEISELEEKEEKLLKEISVLLLPKDPDDEKSAIIEIRAGVGGEEAALFVANLFRMYAYYAEKNGFKVEVISSHPTDIGGFKEIIFSVEGESVYKLFKYESGVHRVQRVPDTEASGRIHTSTATVAILPEAEEVDVEIDPKDLRIDIFRASGHGGQCVQKTESAVRITHLPTGIVASCQDERSQLKNKEKAMKVLRSRVLELYREKQESEIIQERRAKIGRGNRNERIRTYNFPQGRVTDHRIGLSLYNMEAIMEGNLDELFNSLAEYEHEELLKE